MKILKLSFLCSIIISSAICQKTWDYIHFKAESYSNSLGDKPLFHSAGEMFLNQKIGELWYRGLVHVGVGKYAIDSDQFRNFKIISSNDKEIKFTAESRGLKVTGELTKSKKETLVEVNIWGSDGKIFHFYKTANSDEAIKLYKLFKNIQFGGE